MQQSAKGLPLLSAVQPLHPTLHSPRVHSTLHLSTSHTTTGCSESLLLPFHGRLVSGLHPFVKAHVHCLSMAELVHQVLDGELPLVSSS